MYGGLDRKCILFSSTVATDPFLPPQALPEFGPYLTEKEMRVAEYKKTVDPLKEYKPEVHRPAYKTTKPIPTLKVHILLVV